MAEEIDRGSSDRQAIWVALKTLRLRPTVVGRTDEGATVYEVRSVRVVLPPGASHFKRLVLCARCGRGVAGSAILTAADLDRPANSVFCDRCARRTGVSLDREEPAAPAPGDQPPRNPEPDAARLERLEARQAKVMAQLSSPVEDSDGLRRLSDQVAGVLLAQKAELAKMSASMAEVRAEMSELAAQRAVQVETDPTAAMEATLARELADVRSGVAAMVEEAAGPLQAALTDGLHHLRSQVAALQQRIDGAPAPEPESSQVTEAIRQLAQAHNELHQRTGELAARVDASTGPGFEAKLAGELADVRAALAAMTDAAAPALPGAPGDGLDQLRAQMAALQQRIDDESAAPSEITEVAETNRALARAQRDLDRRVRDLAEKVEAAPGVEATVAGELADVRADVASMVDALAQALQAALSEGLNHLGAQVATLQQRIDAARPGDELDPMKAAELAALRAEVATTSGDDADLRVKLAEGLGVVQTEITSLEQRIGDELAAVAALVAAQRKELTEALHDVAHETLMSVAEPLRDLTRAREEFQRRLESLQSRLHALEQRLQVSVPRRIRPAATGSAGQGPPPAPVQRRPFGDLMESLDRQLREAEERLSDL